MGTEAQDTQIGGRQLAPASPTAGGPRAARPAPWQADVVRQMLRRLHDLTVAGRRHDMVKIVALLEERLELARSTMGPRNRDTVRVLLGRLAHAARRPLPDVVDFEDHVLALLDMMGPRLATQAFAGEG